MKAHVDNLQHDLYPEITQYLTGIVDPKDRFLDIETLKKFKVGVGEEKFYDEDDEVWRAVPCIYFPMFS